MKKIIALILSFAFAIPVFADYDELIVNTVRVNVNSGTVAVNDEAIESVAVPYINEAGVTMMEFYTLADALGAAVTEADGVLTVIYDDVEMTYTLNSDVAVIAGQSITMPSAVIRNSYGVVMAPLRFVAEALGADVTYDGELGEIVIVSAGGMDDGINFQLLFRYSGKTKVGNSDEGWRFTKTDNFDMSDGMYGYYMFAMDDISVNLSAEENTDGVTVNQMYISMQQPGYGRTVMYDKGTGELKGVPYAYVKERTLDTVEESYAFVTEDYVYLIQIGRTFEHFSGSESSPDVEAFIQSLEFDYAGGDEENTVDLATVYMDDAYETEFADKYTDGNYSWSISLNDTWVVDEYYGFYNEVVITRPTIVEENDGEYDYMYDDYSYVSDPTISITTYSNPDNQSVAGWAAQKRSIMLATVNSEMCTVTPVSDYKINGRQGKAFEVRIADGEETFVTRYYYLNDGAYRYVIALSFDSREEENPTFRTSADAVIQSFTPGSINKDEVGEALEADSEVESINIKSEFDGEKFSLSYPYLWSVEETETGVFVSSYDGYVDSDTYELISAILPQLSLVAIGSNGASVMATTTSLSYYNDNLELSEYTLEEYMKKQLAAMLNMSGSLIRIELESEIKEAELLGKKGYSVDIVAESMGEKMYYTIYYIPKDSKSFINIVKACDGYTENTVYEEAADEVIKSIQFVEG